MVGEGSRIEIQPCCTSKWFKVVPLITLDATSQICIQSLHRPFVDSMFFVLQRCLQNNAAKLPLALITNFSVTSTVSYALYDQYLSKILFISKRKESNQ